MTIGNALNQSITQHAVPVGTSTGTLTSLSVGADHSLLLGATGADPSFSTTGTPYVTSISFDAGTNSLATYTTGTWTPTIVGDATAGTTTYTSQIGRYVKIGKIVYATFQISITAATGTGGVLLGTLPFTIVSSGAQPVGSCFMSGTSGWVYGVSTTCIFCIGISNSTTFIIQCQGSNLGVATLQMHNGAESFGGTLVYEAAT